MKKFLTSQNLLYSICLAMFISFFPFTQEKTSEVLRLGFPYKFYTIYTSHNSSIHFGIGTFLFNVLVIYLIYTLVFATINKIKKA